MTITIKIDGLEDLINLIKINYDEEDEEVDLDENDKEEDDESLKIEDFNLKIKNG